MKKIVVATHNLAKIEELKFGLRELESKGIKLLTLNDVRVEEEPEESGSTFKENAEIKARFYSKLTGLPTIADDGGLIIPYLNNEPGVRSRRWLGRDATDEELIQYTLHNLYGVKDDDRTAYLETCVCFFDPISEKIFYEQEKVKGHIAEKATGRPTNGYPFRALFVVDEFNKYYDELNKKEHDIINHRFKALKRLTKKIEVLL